MQYEDTNEYIFCRACGAKKKDLRNHIKSEHGLTSKEYKEQYLNAPITSNNSKQKMSKGISNSHSTRSEISDETKLKISQKGKERHARERQQNPEEYLKRQQNSAQKARDAKGDDYKHSDATLEKMRGPRPSLQGVPKSEEHRKKLSESRTGKTFSPHSPETIQKMKDAWERRKADKEKYAEYVKSVSERMSTPEMIEALRTRNANNIINGNHNGKSSDTSLEQKFEKFLIDKNLEYQKQYPLEYKGLWLYDFYIPSMNMLVEADGEYWHGKNVEIWNRDMIKIKLAKTNGITLVKISDKNWKPEIIFESVEMIEKHVQSLMTERAIKLKLIQLKPSDG